jgi:acetyl esterase/lipase
MARDAGGPHVAGQVLITPVTDCDLTRDSYVVNADGYLLTTALMRWFWDHYADPADRAHPKASPLRARSLAGLPPALVVTCEFDPLRDEGAAYADALAASGVDVHHLACRGQMHTSLAMVDLIVSANDAREEVADAIRRFLGADRDEDARAVAGAPLAPGA